ncbi:MAG: MBL fold metallo-hydrolase [Ruminiclostridium sp.]|jgi:L-ascorbate metabolism protein UlaG (beta-lactamase superfamily)|nr:MBL fold metallo-hydrolase [Ruminiclostridium sp.]
MNITFLYHSAFLVELDTCSLLFDWYGGTVPDYDRSRPLYVFNSHHHGDHYSPEIFSALGMDNVWYILGSCIRLSAKRKAALGIVEEQVCRLGPGHTLTLGPLQIQTLPSTDAGVAFLVEAEGRTLFHAGDLNWWHWEGEPSPWNETMERDFKAAAAQLQGRAIDAAFLVLDPRQGDAYWWGFDWLMRTVQAKAAFPMHSWEDFPIVQRLKRRPESQPYRDRIQEIYYHGQNFTLEG